MMPHRILVVEDSRTQALRLQLELLRHGLSIEIATTGPSGLQAARMHLPDAIILDIDLPGMDGYSVCHLLKTDPRTAYIPIVMLTHHDQAMDTIIGLETGANDYIPKDIFAERNIVSSLEQLGIL